MRLLKFTANNLFSLGEIELDLDKRGLVLITGHSIDEGGANGSGKSSLSNKGVLWTLFGSTASGERADAAINKFAAADSTCRGILDVESNNGSQFRIVRSRNPNRLSLSDLATSQDLSAKTEKETQVLINKVLGRTRETFLQTDFFGQGKLSAFLDLTPKAQVELLETILPFDQLSQLSEKSKDFLSKLTIIKSSIDRRLSEQQGKVLEAQRQERVLSDSIDKWDTEQDQKLVALQTRIATLGDDVFVAKVERLKQRSLELPNMLECERALQEVKNYFVSINAMEIDTKTSLRKWQQTLVELKPAVEPSAIKDCPTCRQPINQYTQRDIERDFADWKSQRADIQSVIRQVELTIVDIDLARKQAYEKQREIEQTIHQVREFEAELRQADNERNNGELAILKQNLEATQAEVNPYTELYNQTSNVLGLAIQNLSLHKARQAEVQKDQGALGFWRDAFGKELKNEFISQVCPFLESRTNQHLDGLGNPQLKVSVRTRKHLKSDEERSEFTVTASSNTGGGSYDSLSGGERQLVSFAMGLALADLAELQTDGPSYFMVLDEPFMALDTRNSENLVNYLNSYLNGKKETILLVSNEETLKNLIPNRINVVKENGVSRIE